MESTFQVPSNREERSKLLTKVRQEAASEGIAFSGNEDTGSFTGNTLFGGIAGSYAVEGSTLTVRLTEYPRFVPQFVLRGILTKVFR